MKRARHKRIVFHCVAEHDDFRAAETFGRNFSRAFDGFACQLDRIHIDTGARAADIDGAAHDVGSLHCFGNRTNQHFVRRRHAFLHQRGKAADKGHADGFGCLVQSLRYADVRIGFGCRRDLGNRRNGNTLIHNWHAVFGRQVFCRRHQIFADSGDFVVNVLVQYIDVGADAVVQINADGNGAHVKILVGHHFDGF